MSYIRSILVILALAASTVVALAHPHAWITVRSDIITNQQGLITGIGQLWQFDDGYRATALEGLDATADGIYSEAEIAPLTDENIKSLEEFNYFVVLQQNGKKQEFGIVTKAQQRDEKGILLLSFDIPLAVPVDPAKGEVTIKIYDPEFFIAYDYAKTDPYTLRGALAPGCTAELRPVLTDAQLEEQRAFLATKGTDWKPDTEVDFGSEFAQPLAVTCGATQTATPAIDKNKLLVQQRNTASTVAFSDSPVQWVQQKQQQFYSSLSGALRKMQTSPSAIWTLIGLSLLYGVFHAAGPGHGKAVVSAWLLANEHDLKRGVLIAGLSALIQALVAIILMSILFLVVESAAATARSVAVYIDSFSFAMITLLGLYLIWTAFRHGHEDHNHHHDDHGHDHDHDHAHVAKPDQVRGDWSLTKAFSLAFAVGIRPCTGALLVLSFAKAAGLYWAGIVSTLMMGLGVFAAVAVIAAMSVYARRFAVRMAAKDDRTLSYMATGARILGGLVIAALGTVLFLGSLGTTPAMA